MTAEPPGTEAVPRRARSARQEAKNADTRNRIIEAGGLVVGEVGYAAASVARITQAAGVAHGAFYLHFEGRQALFDVLLPTLGKAMLAAIGKAVVNSAGIEELERRGAQANVDYLVRHPGLYRVLYEAPEYAPSAYEAHIAGLRAAYVRSLRRSREAREIAAFADAELETIAMLLMGARFYLMAQCWDGRRMRPLTEMELRLYTDFACAGLKREPAARAAPPRPGAP